ncbi:MAG: hypothetical protein ACOCRX_09665 [Candidatus Woesearchaeota archaeon]
MSKKYIFIDFEAIQHGYGEDKEFISVIPRQAGWLIVDSKTLKIEHTRLVNVKVDRNDYHPKLFKAYRSIWNKFREDTGTETKLYDPMGVSLEDMYALLDNDILNYCNGSLPIYVVKGKVLESRILLRDFSFLNGRYRLKEDIRDATYNYYRNNIIDLHSLGKDDYGCYLVKKHEGSHIPRDELIGFLNQIRKEKKEILKPKFNLLVKKVFKKKVKKYKKKLIENGKWFTV